MEAVIEARAMSLLGVVTSAALLAGCATTHSTRLTVDDFEQMTEAMATSLKRSDALRERTPSSSPWWIAVQEVTNLTSDVLSESEKWFVVQRIRSSLPMQAVQEQRNVHFVIPRAQMQRMRRDPTIGAQVGDFDQRFGEDRPVTHVMTAVLRSATRAQARQRTDLYYAEFEILDLDTGEPVWTDRFEFKRAATGHIWD